MAATTGYRHGVYTSEVPTAIIPARVVNSNVVVCVGTAAIHTLPADRPRYINVPRLYYSFDEFVMEMGWDADRFSDYSLQELIYSQFALYQGAPVVVVNVFDPSVHKEDVTAQNITFAVGGSTANTAALAHTHINNVVVQDTLDTTTYVADTDYTVNLVSGIVTRLAAGSISEGASVHVSYTYADVSLVDSADIIGGIDVDTGDPTGLECLDDVFPRFRLVPSTLVCPKYGEDPAVAVIMAAKADNINGLFKAICLVDIPTDGPDGVKKYTDAPGYKESNNLTDELMVVCWPKVKLGNMVFGLATHLAGVISDTDANHEGIPYASPSNKRMDVTSCGYPDSASPGGWKEVWLDLNKANYLNGQGIYTVSGFDGGMKSWGGRMACYPSNTDPKDAWDSVRRFFNWYQAQFILTYFSRIDSPMTRRFVQTILRSEQIKLDGYTSREILLGGSISFDESENPTTDLIDGICRFHLRITPPVPTRDIEGIFEFDTDNLSVLFT